MRYLAIFIITAAAAALVFVSCAEEEGCTDKDGDGYYAQAMCGDVIDCNDNDPDVHTKCCRDFDGDGFGEYCAGDDCAPYDPKHWKDCGVCWDKDGDGYGIDCDLSERDGMNGPDATDWDCAPADKLHWSDCDVCIDNDNDGRGKDCNMGPDCNNSNTNVWKSCGSCRDNDGDVWFAGCDRYATIEGPDCDDQDSNHWINCPEDDDDEECIDKDNDGYGEGCARGPDCDDTDRDNWDSCDTCVDEDGDGCFIDCDTYIDRDGPDRNDNVRSNLDC